MLLFRILQVILILCFFFKGYSQFQANYWYFGNFNGIQFTNGYSECLTNGKLKTPEGCATISDSLGNLLFYTNGKVLYGKNHQLINNQLVGNPEATQSSIFIPYPTQEDTVLLFVNGAFGNGGLHYYLLSSSQQNIIAGPFLLYQPTCEKITAVHQPNYRDFWLLTHEWNSNQFVCFSITNQGISNPMITAVGSVHSGTSVIASGTMKFSLQGNQVACAIPYLNLVERFDFQNGVLSNPRSKFIRNPYGVSFSPNGQILYATGYYFATGGAMVNEVFQWNIQNQILTVGSWTCPLFTPEIIIGDISNAMDGKMYIAKKDAQSLAVVENPNQNGITCNFLLNGLPTPNYLVQFGLPNFVQSYLVPPLLNFQIPPTACVSDTVNICAYSQLQGNYEWYIDNQTLATTSQCLNYTFTIPGEHVITLKQQGYQVSKKIQIYTKPQNPFSQNTIYACKGEVVYLDAQNNGANYFWSNGMSNPIIPVNRSGNYNVKVYYGSGKCPEIFSVQVVFVDTPQYDFNDTLICDLNSITLQNPFVDAQAIWNGNLYSDTFTVTQNGTYTVKLVRLGVCEWSDTFQIKISPPWIRTLPTKVSFCPIKEHLELDAGKAFHYLWNTNDTTQKIIIQEPGKYQVLKTDINGCSTYEEVEVTNACNLLFMPNVFTPNQDGKNESLKPISGEPMDYEMFIFNSSGELIYQGLEWDGSQSPEGTYIVLVQGKWQNGKSFNEVYSVMLIR